MSVLEHDSFGSFFNNRDKNVFQNIFYVPQKKKKDRIRMTLGFVNDDRFSFLVEPSL